MTITTDTTLLHDPRRQAALLYWQGFSVPQIAAMLQMNARRCRAGSSATAGTALPPSAVSK
ncbi:ATPase subunit of terminase family protein [Escherichia coli p0305293.15]|nr:ATPase subunit of terminase family protein [Escherichia coli p0305293.15]